MADAPAEPRGDLRTTEGEIDSRLEWKSDHIGDFWRRYDRLADQKEKELTKKLNENLDVLLIFAGLFSAVNAIFISLSLPSLSPNAPDETNHLLRLLVLRADNQTLTPADLSLPFSQTSTSVLASCLLVSSLCFSLLAAVGAMLAKEWLQNYDLTEHHGPLEERGRYRQLKYAAGRRWHLEEIIQWLPSVVILSVLLFFLGLIVLLTPLNHIAAGLAIAFGGLGASLYLATSAAGAISPLCPYQSTVSRWMRLVGNGVSYTSGKATGTISRAWRRSVSAWQPQIFKKASRSRKESKAASEFGKRGSGKSYEMNGQVGPACAGHASREDSVLDAQAACWLLETTSNFDDQRAVAQIISSLPATSCYVMSQDSDAWRHLLFLTRDALRQRQNDPDDTCHEGTAELFGLALYHVLAGFDQSSEPWEEVWRILPSETFPSSEGSPKALGFIIRPARDKLPLVHVARELGSATSNLPMKKAVLHSAIFWNNEPYLEHLLPSFLDGDSDGSIFSMLAFYFWRRYNGQRRPGTSWHISPSYQQTTDRNMSLLRAYSGQDLQANLMGALDAGVIVFANSGTQSDKIAKIYAAFVRMARTIIKSDDPTAQSFLKSLVTLMVGVSWRNKRTVEPTLLVVEVLGAMKILLSSRDDSSKHLPDDVVGALWLGVEHVMEVAKKFPLAETKFNLEGVIFETLDFDYGSSGSYCLPGIEDHPRVVAWLVACLGGRPSTRSGSLRLMHKFEGKCFSLKSPLQEMWIKHGLATQLVSTFQSLEDPDDRLRMDRIIMTMTSVEPSRWCPELANAGFVPAAVDAIHRLCEGQENSTSARQYHLYLVLVILSRIWEYTQGSGTDDWTDERTVSVIQRAVSSLRVFLPLESETKAGFSGQLGELMRLIQQHQGASALNAHNFDANGLYEQRPQSGEWEYAAATSIPCSPSDLGKEEML